MSFQNFQMLNNLVIKVEEKLVKTFGYYTEDRISGKISQEQKGVMRTNCLDCLDRTNVVQTRLAFRIIDDILDRLKSLNRNPQLTEHLREMGFTEATNDGYIHEILKNMWADNGDVISRQYAGTSSTITSVTKTGKQGFLGKLDQMRRGVERFIVNNIDDGLKHECIKLFLNQHPQQ